MILEIIATYLLASAAVALIDAMIDWAAEVIKKIANAVVSVLYALREASRAVFQLFTRTSNNQWLETTRAVSESELPPELRNLNVGNKVEISRWS